MIDREFNVLRAVALHSPLGQGGFIHEWWKLARVAIRGSFVLWFLIFGWAFNWACIEAMPNPPVWRFSVFLGAVMFATALTLGVGCSGLVAAGKASQWHLVQRIAPLVFAASIAGIEAWWLPDAVAALGDIPVVLRPPWIRLAGGVASAIPVAASVVMSEAFVVDG